MSIKKKPVTNVISQAISNQFLKMASEGYCPAWQWSVI